MLVVWTARVGRSLELPIGCVRRLTGAFAARTRKVDFFLSNHRPFRSNFALARSWAWPLRCTIDFLRKRTQTCKTKCFFQQCELRKTDTAREVCVGMAAQIAVAYPCSYVLLVIVRVTVWNLYQSCRACTKLTPSTQGAFCGLAGLFLHNFGTQSPVIMSTLKVIGEVEGSSGKRHRLCLWCLFNIV